MEANYPYGIRLLAPATLRTSQPMRAEPCLTSTNESGEYSYQDNHWFLGKEESLMATTCLETELCLLVELVEGGELFDHLISPHLPVSPHISPHLAKRAP